MLSREPHGPLLVILKRRTATPDGAKLLDVLPSEGALSAARWPFARVMTQNVALDTASAPGFVTVRVPAQGGRLEAAFGINPDRWLGLKSGPFHFAIVVLTRPGNGERGERAIVFEQSIDPAREVGDRRWLPVSIDLDRFAGQEILLAFRIETPNLADSPDGLAGWVEPRVVARDGANGRTAADASPLGAERPLGAR